MRSNMTFAKWRPYSNVLNVFELRPTFHLCLTIYVPGKINQCPHWPCDLIQVICCCFDGTVSWCASLERPGNRTLERCKCVSCILGIPQSSPPSTIHAIRDKHGFHVSVLFSNLLPFVVPEDPWSILKISGISIIESPCLMTFLYLLGMAILSLLMSFHIMGFIFTWQIQMTPLAISPIFYSWHYIKFDLMFSS